MPKLGFPALPGRQPQDPEQTAVVRSCQMVEVAQVAPLPAREEMLVLHGGSSAGEGARADLPAPSRGHDSLVGRTLPRAGAAAGREDGLAILESPGPFAVSLTLRPPSS